MRQECTAVGNYFQHICIYGRCDYWKIRIPDFLPGITCWVVHVYWTYFLLCLEHFPLKNSKLLFRSTFCSLSTLLNGNLSVVILTWRWFREVSKLVSVHWVYGMKTYSWTIHGPITWWPSQYSRATPTTWLSQYSRRIHLATCVSRDGLYLYSTRYCTSHFPVT